MPRPNCSPRSGPTRPRPAAAPQRRHGAASLWWQGERLHRAVLRDYRARAPAVQEELGPLQAEFMRRAAEASRDGPASAAALAAILSDARRAVAEWTAHVETIPGRPHGVSFYRRAWHGLERSAGA